MCIHSDVFHTFIGQLSMLRQWYDLAKNLITPHVDNNISSENGEDVIRHHLRLFGITSKFYKSKCDRIKLPVIEIVYKRNGVLSESKVEEIKSGLIIISVLPEMSDIEKLGINLLNSNNNPPEIFKQTCFYTKSPLRLRTLHAWKTINATIGKPIVIDSMGSTIWLWYPLGLGGVLFIGTDLAEDLIRYRQGNPKSVSDSNRQQRALWGFDFERPVYLYEQQLLGESKYARPADDWMYLLTNFLSQELGFKTEPVLPGNAKGAVIITGDDDQAFLEKYEAQLKFLKETPMTYFMHPLTKHTRDTIETMLNKSYIDIGIHPDALNKPSKYKYLLNKQTKWFKNLFGRPPLSVRNHGFLNDGYWGHLNPWISNEIKFSSNIPGLNGRILTGSLLPARTLFDNKLTEHWSLLTSIGDGIVFINGCTAKEGLKCIYDLADTIILSNIPGIIVINLHPQNFHDTMFLHHAMLELIKNGFHPWTVSECYQWFYKRDCRE